MVASPHDRAGCGSARAQQLVPTVRLSSVAMSFCLAICLNATFALSAVADDPPEGKESKVEQLRSSVLRLPELLKPGRRKTSSPDDSKATKASPDRFVSRAMQLLDEARNLEKNGKAEAALEMAQRAESVLKTAQYTTGSAWPAGEESPEQYIAAMKLRTGATGDRGSVGATAGNTKFVPGRPLPYPKPASATPPPPENRSKAPEQTTTSNAGPSSGLEGKPLLDWGSRLPFTGIALTAGTQQENAETEAETSSDGSDTDVAIDESSLLLQQLDKLESWTSAEPHEASTDDGSSSAEVTPDSDQMEDSTIPPLVIPGLIDRPDEIDDQNVGPIPTRPTESVSGSSSEAVTTTIPVVPDPTENLPLPGNGTRPDGNRIATTDTEPIARPETSVYDSSPLLLTNAGDETATNQASVWQLAAAQLLSTFLGVVIAVAAFLLMRAIAVRLFGTHLGVTFQIGSGKSAKTSANTDSETADVVPFGRQHENTTELDELPKRAGGVANPEDFPFRVVGSSTGEEEYIQEQQAEQEREGAILKTVFEHNVQLLDKLDHDNESAA